MKTANPIPMADTRIGIIHEVCYEKEPYPIVKIFRTKTRATEIPKIIFWLALEKLKNLLR